MNGYNNYDALASTIKIEDITSKETNRNILRRLKENDPTVEKLWVCKVGDDEGDDDDDDDDGCNYDPDHNNEDDMGWLGYFIGKNTSLKEFHFRTQDVNNPEALCTGMNNNQSIMKIGFHGVGRLDGHIFGVNTFGMLNEFFRNNHNLIEMEVSGCNFMVGDIRQLSLALGGCTKSLKGFSFANNRTEHGNVTDVLVALSMHPQLENLDLSGMTIERNEYVALATLFRNTTKQLQTLDGVEILVHAIGGSELRFLDLSFNSLLTNRGWGILSTILERPDSNLEKLLLSNNNLSDEGALMFVNALRGNNKLKYLNLRGNGITVEGWAHFSKLLCDTSSVNNTYLSNHTLGILGGSFPDISADVISYLTLNKSSEDKGQVAMTKILRYHSHFNMQPFFEWEFKILPLVIGWLEKANACTTEFEEKIRRLKLSCMYEFVREFPMLYVEPVTRKEIEECSAMEEQLVGDDSIQNASQLEVVRQRKTRAARRLL